ncbi:MAG: hypothetical protein V2A74_03760 [bacterium]
MDPLQKQLMGERHWLEKLGDWIPGYAGYQKREQRRDTDHLVRDYAAQQLRKGRLALDEKKATWSRGGELGVIGYADKISRKLEIAHDKLLCVERGYSGFFDLAKVGDIELQTLYDYDQQLLSHSKSLTDALESLPDSPQEAEGKLKHLLAEVQRLLDAMDDRATKLAELKGVH